MTFKKRAGGVWADPAAVKRMSGGSWVDVTEVKAREGGAWVVVWPLYGVSITNTSVSATNTTPAGATAIYRVGSDGIIYKKIGAGSFTAYETWMTYGANTAYEVRFTETASNGLGNETYINDTWLATTSNNDVELQSSLIEGLANRTILVEIRYIPTTTTLDSASINLTTERT